METVILLILISLLISAFLIWKKLQNKFVAKIIGIVHFIFLTLAVFCLALLVNGYRFNGQYTNSLIGILFIITGILLFGFTKLVILKIYSGFIVIPSLIMEIGLLFTPNGFMLPFIIVSLLYQPPYLVEKIDKQYNIEIHQGFMGPPNIIYLTYKKSFLFRKQTRMQSKGEILSQVKSIKILKFSADSILVCQVYLDEQSSTIDTLIATK